MKNDHEISHIIKSKTSHFVIHKLIEKKDKETITAKKPVDKTKRYENSDNENQNSNSNVNTNCESDKNCNESDRKHILNGSAPLKDVRKEL